ncbi:polynucleotide 5'-hydroxyl-kinase NOL9 isoform 1-T1 [Synchiropus picturatus]
MKVNKHAQVKVKSQKWTKVKGNQSRGPIRPSDLNSSPVMAKLVQEHHAKKKKPSVKRLKGKVKSVSGAPIESRKSCTNGGVSMESEDSEDWEEYSRSLQMNGMDTDDGQLGRLEGDAFHHCAERDDQKNHAVLVMQKDQTLCFRGKCFLTCLYGRVEVMGFTIEEGQESYPVLSPASHCPLTITALRNSDNSRDPSTEVGPILQKYLPTASCKRLLRRVKSNSSLILLEPMVTPLTRFLSSFPGFNELFSPTMSELMSAVLDTPLNGLGMVPLLSTVHGLKLSQSCREALDSVVSACRGDMDGCAVILVCGAKNVGKSTYIRVLLNTLLNHTTSVDYLEGDLGQTEFTPSGCLSMTTVREPLLGPPFTHQRTPDHMVYYGETSCEKDLDRYLECLKSLWSQRPQNRETPIIINTMGWVKGFGFQLLVDMIRFFPVTHVVQLSHGGVTQCPALTPGFLRMAQGFQTHPPAQTALDELNENQSLPRNYVLHLVHSDFELAGQQGNSRHQRANEQRELCLLAYLSDLQSPDPGPVRPLHTLTPYQVPHTAVALGVTHCEVAPTHMFYAANASLVGLCCLGEKVTSRGGPVVLSQAPICPCVGFGVLRGVDMARGLYFLLTPVEPSVLRKVNCLLLGAISLPSCILTSQDATAGELPYITTDYSFDITGAGKIRVFKGLLRPEHLK